MERGAMTSTGYVLCKYCGNWHAADYECAAMKQNEPDAEIDAWYHCVECGRIVRLDDVAHGVVTKHGRAICWWCSRYRTGTTGAVDG